MLYKIWFTVWGLREKDKHVCLLLQPGATFELNIELLQVTPPVEKEK